MPKRRPEEKKLLPSFQNGEWKPVPDLRRERKRHQEDADRPVGSDPPILEFDPSRDAVLEPSRIHAPIEIPEHAVLCFFQDVIDSLRDSGRARAVATQKSEIGAHPVYLAELNGRPFALFHPGVGAPLAAGFLEEIIALGARKIIVSGGAGVLDPSIAAGGIVIPTSAVRDEGTSYHYLPPSREVEPDPSAVAALETVLRKRGLPYLLGKTWTTDGLYRETREKVRRRRGEGCVTVEMEAAALFAVARFRNVRLAQVLYGADDVSGGEWDARDWDRLRAVREDLLWIAAEACLTL
jgi:uridine phosphorylase